MSSPFWDRRNSTIICDEVMSCSVSTFAIIHRGKRWLRRPTLAAIKSEAKEAGSMRIDEGGGFLGRVLDFFSAFSMEQI